VQGVLWSARAREWADHQEAQHAPLYVALIDALNTRRGLRLLDAGCGAGLAAWLAEERGFVVSAFDAAPALAGITRERLPHSDIREGDLEQIPFGDDSFDVAMAFNAVQFASDHLAAVRELVRVVVPGGKVGIGMWAEHDRSETSRVFDALGAVMPTPPPGAPAPFALERRGALEELMEAAGIAIEEGEDVEATFHYRSLDVAMTALLSAGPLVRAEEAVGVETIHDTLRAVLLDHQQQDESIVMCNVFRYVIGTTRR